MSVSSSKQIYKCFVCGAGGNVFTFVKDYEEVSFVEAVVKVAATIGIDISNALEHSGPSISKETQKYFDIMNDATSFYSYQLKTSKDELVGDFLRQRKIDETLIDNFQLGLSSSQNQLTTFLTSKGYTYEDLVAINLVRRQDESFSDVFYDRLLFPIADHKGQVVGFSGRAISANNSVKYINTSSTPIYSKGDLLYNYHRVNDREMKKEALVITEGVMDVLAFYKAGYQRVIASLGTAFTPNQAQLVKRLNTHVVLAYDKDAAGLSATYQIGNLLSENNVKLSVYNNTTSLDPDDYQKEKGSNALIETINTAKHWIEFVIEYATSLYSLHSYQSKKEVVSFVFKHLARFEPFDQTYFINQLADLTGFNNIDLHNQLSNVDKVTTRTQPLKNKRRVRPKSTLLRSEKEILSLIINSKQAAYYFRDELGFLIDPDANQLALMILETYTHHDVIEIADLLNKQLSNNQLDILMNLDEEPIAQENIKDVLFDDMKHIQMVAIDQQIQDLQEKAQSELDINQKIKIGKEISVLVLEKNKVRNKEINDETI